MDMVEARVASVNSPIKTFKLMRASCRRAGAFYKVVAQSS
jgi:hypothetical protein